MRREKVNEAGEHWENLVSVKQEGKTPQKTTTHIKYILTLKTIVLV